MAKLINLLARLRGHIGRPSFAGLLAMLFVATLQFSATQPVQAQQVGADFDHSSTGYVLNAQHQNVRCETCHVKGVFKGTPKDCESCHGWNNPRATLSVMPVTHIPTGNATCESCHQANMAQFVDATRTFNHATVRSLTCVNCHSSNNPHPNVRTNPSDATHQAVMAQGQACDQCHTTIVFTGPKKPSNHIPISPLASCASCHTNADYGVMPSITAIHANAPSSNTNCADCHSASNAAKFATAKMVPPLMAPPTGNCRLPIAPTWP
jgi:Class III cytochrome C family